MFGRKGIRLFIVAAAALLSGCTSDEERKPAAPSSFVLVVGAAGSGLGTVTSDDGASSINCSSTGGICQATLPVGAIVTLTAAKGASSEFSAWSGCAGATGTTCVVEMTSNREVTAIFNLVAAGGSGDLYVLTADNHIASFDPAQPGILKSSVPVTGLVNNDEHLVAIEFRPADGLLYGLTKRGATATGEGRIYRIHKHSRAGTLISTLNTDLSGNEFAMDFDPVSDSLRVISDTGQSLAVSPVEAGTTSATTVAAGISAAAHANNIAGAAASPLYVINSSSDQVLMLASSGSTAPLSQPLGPDVTAANGFDIDSRTETAYLSFTTTSHWLGTVNLETGALEGSSPLAIAPTKVVRGLAVAIPPAPEVFGVEVSGNQQNLIKFSPKSPDKLTRLARITGLDTDNDGVNDDVIVGIDFRPPGDTLYAMARGPDGAGKRSGQLYTIDLSSGAATAVGNRQLDALDADALFGATFEPDGGALRLVSTTAQHLAASATTGSLQEKGVLHRPAIVPTGVAFNNSQTTPVGSTATYVIDATSGRLGTVESGPNEGRYSTVARLKVPGVDLALPLNVRGFEIIGVVDSNPTAAGNQPNQVALVVLSIGAFDVLYQVDLVTGIAEQRGSINGGLGRVVGITAAPNPDPTGTSNQDVFAITNLGYLISFSRSFPAALTRSCELIATTEVALSIEIEPSSGNLLVLTSEGAGQQKRLRTFDFTPPPLNVPQTCPQAPVIPSTVLLETGAYVNEDLDDVVEMDFDASTMPNTLHITTAAGLHLVVANTTGPSSGVAKRSSALCSKGICDRAPVIGAAAYADEGAVLYDINLDGTGAAGGGTAGTNGLLMIQDLTTGALSDVGVLFPSSPPAVDPSVMSLAIFGKRNALAFAVLKNLTEDLSRLYRVDLATGQLTEIGNGIGAGGVTLGTNFDFDPNDPGDPRQARTITDIAISFPPVP